MMTCKVSYIVIGLLLNIIVKHDYFNVLTNHSTKILLTCYQL